MSITDELREYVQSWRGTPNLMDELDAGDIDGLLGDFIAIADHIDAEHQKACDDAWNNGYEADYLGIEKWLSEHPQAMEHHGWVRPPKDADGVPIHAGDVLEFSAFEIEKPVTRMVDGIGQGVFFAWCGERGYQQHEAKRYRHHHEPTVEDVLRDMHAKLDEVTALYVGEAIDSDERDSDEARIFAEYASKLRLTGDVE